MDFDPNDAGIPGQLFGLPDSPSDAHVVVVPVPFDATTSYRDGTRDGPAAVLAASAQVDLYDLEYGNPYSRGIAMLPLDRGMALEVAAKNREARAAAPAVRDRRDAAARAVVDACGARVNALVEETVAGLLEQGRLAVVLGGDHSTPFGSIRAHAARFPGLGILHIDAHADLRVAYEGFEWSHASIMHNVTSKIGAAGGVAALVQVGIRDFCEEEHMAIRHAPADHGTRILTHFDAPMQEALLRGGNWAEQAAHIVADLPEQVYVSLDIDGLDPTLCPDTGTPVPGGLSVHQLWGLLRALRRGGHRVVGFDLNEVAPARGLAPEAWGKDWNANVGARVLYKLIGAALGPSGV